MRKVFVILILFFVCGKVYADSNVLINEFTVEPTQSVELINSGSEIVDLSNWIIDDGGGTTYFTIPSNSLLYPNSCLILSGDFNLNKSSADTVKLLNNSNTLIDSFTYNSSPGTGISYLRLPDKSINWTIGISSLGKFNQTGENCLFLPTPTIIPTSIPTLMPTEEPTSTPAISYDNVYISEVMVAPESGNKEWVELYNDNDFVASLEKWYIDDEENAGASPKSFSLILSAKSYATFDLSTSIFNNDGDSVRLLDPQKLVKDSLEYNSSTKGKTLGRLSFEEDRFCLQEPTKGQANGGCVEANPTPTETATEETEITLSPTISPVKANLALNMQPQTPTGGVIDPTGSVLSSSTPSLSINRPTASLVKPLSFLSFTYSLLTISSVLLKIKLNV